MIDGEITRSASEGDEVPRDQTTVREHLGRRGRRDLLLIGEVLPAHADGDGDDDKIGKPLPALPDVQNMVPQQ